MNEALRSRVVETTAGLSLAERIRERTANPLALKVGEDDLDAFISAQERGQRIQQKLVALAEPLAGMTERLYRTDRSEFNRQDHDIEAVLNEVETLLVGFRAAAESEYAPLAWHVRLMLWTFSFVATVRKVRRAYVLVRRRRDALIAAAAEYQELVDGHRETISDIRYAKVNLRVGEVLGKDKEYQKLLGEVPHIKRKIRDSENPSGWRSILRENEERCEQITSQVRSAVLLEFEDEDF